jgi:hypothetical protein
MVSGIAYERWLRKRELKRAWQKRHLADPANRAAYNAYHRDYYRSHLEEQRAYRREYMRQRRKQEKEERPDRPDGWLHAIRCEGPVNCTCLPIPVRLR